MNLSFLRRRQIDPAELAPVPVAPKPGPGPVVTRAAFTPPPAPAAPPTDRRFTPGRYVVTYDRIGRHGDRRIGLPAPIPLTVVADSAADLAERIRTDVAPYTGDRAEITIDLDVSGGKITRGDVTGTFTFARGGAR